MYSVSGLDDPMIYVGLTGLSRTGKGTVAQLLWEMGKSQDLRVFRYSLSDEIRHEWHLRYGDQGKANPSQARKMTRLELINLGDEGRREGGEGFWAQRVIERIQAEVDHVPDQPALVIVDSIRSPGEVDRLRDQWGSRFVLLALDARKTIREARGIQRAREGEQNGTPQHVEQADREIGIETCVALADSTIHNNGSIADLVRECHEFVEQFIVPLLPSEK